MKTTEIIAIKKVVVRYSCEIFSFSQLKLTQKPIKIKSVYSHLLSVIFYFSKNL